MCAVCFTGKSARGPRSRTSSGVSLAEGSPSSLAADRRRVSTESYAAMRPTAAYTHGAAVRRQSEPPREDAQLPEEDSD
jgi:hypothetical protein